MLCPQAVPTEAETDGKAVDPDDYVVVNNPVSLCTTGDRRLVVLDRHPDFVPSLTFLGPSLLPSTRKCKDMVRPPP